MTRTLTLLPILGTLFFLSNGCIASGRTASPEVTATAGLTADLTVGPRVGTIGGGEDTIALWLAILAPVLGAGLYKYGFRPFRLWRENGRSGGNGKPGETLCVKYDRRT